MKITVLSVKQLNSYVKSLLESDNHLSSFYLSGEISNFKDHYQSGHLYFSLKDSDAVIKAVMFRFSAAHLKFKPQDGMKVICRGRVSLYERDGTYQFYVEDMIPEGVGDLTLAFNQIKEKLEKAGYFLESHKKPIPKFPKRIAVITSDTGAAVMDILNITGRRWPLCEIIMCPVHVQGELAVPDLINAITRVQTVPDIDTIIIGRGGGSAEDLWAFNSEELATAIYSCKIPVISAVGHETDFTICDFVADLRAPTPSAAAELAVPDCNKFFEHLGGMDKRLRFIIAEQVKSAYLKIQLLNTRMRTVISEMITDKAQQIDSFSDKLCASLNDKLKCCEKVFGITLGKLNTLNPLSVLARGYTVTTKDNLSVTARELKTDDKITVKFLDGTANCIVDSVDLEK